MQWNHCNLVTLRYLCTKTLKTQLSGGSMCCTTRHAMKVQYAFKLSIYLFPLTYCEVHKFKSFHSHCLKGILLHYVVIHCLTCQNMGRSVRNGKTRCPFQLCFVPTWHAHAKGSLVANTFYGEGSGSK